MILGSVFGPERRSFAKQDIVVHRKVKEAGPSEKCGFCGRVITSVETPWVINKKLIVCKECYDKIKG